MCNTENSLWPPVIPDEASSRPRTVCSARNIPVDVSRIPRKSRKTVAMKRLRTNWRNSFSMTGFSTKTNRTALRTPAFIAPLP